MRYIKYTFSIIVCLLVSLGLVGAQNTLSLEDQRKFDFYFFEAMNAKANSKYDQSYDLLRHCQSLDSTNANANVLYELGNYYGLLSQKEKAREYYKQAKDYDKDNFYYAAAYASISLEFKQYEESINVYQSLIDKNPNKTDLYIYLAEANRLDGNLRGAIAALDKLEENIGLNEKVSLQKFQFYTLLGEENKGFSEIEKHIEKNPNEIKYLVLLGDLYLRADRNTDALTAYKKAENMDSENPLLISSMAQYYEQIDDKEAAERTVQAAISNEHMDVENKLAILAQYVGTLQESEKDITTVNPLFDKLIQLHPLETNINMMYGNLLTLQENKDEAYSQFEIFAKAHPNNPNGWEQMLSVSFPDSINKAIYVGEMAVKNIPDEPQFYFFLGLAHYLNDEYEKALFNLKNGLKYLSDDNPRLLSDFYGQMGDIYHQSSKKDSAFIAYEQSLRYNPQNLGILNNYSYFLSLSKKDLNKAEKMSALTIKAEPSNPTYLDTYGWVLFKQGAYTMAKWYVEKSIENTKEEGNEVSAEVLEHYGDILYKLNDKEQALKYWEDAKSKLKEPSEILDEKIEAKTYIEKDEQTK